MTRKYHLQRVYLKHPFRIDNEKYYEAYILLPNPERKLVSRHFEEASFAINVSFFDRLEFEYDIVTPISQGFILTHNIAMVDLNLIGEVEVNDNH